VIYTVSLSRGTETVSGGSFTATVKPTLYLAWLWHQHQPLYRVATAGALDGHLRYPWVRLHAIRDYYSMAAVVSESDVHLTIDLTPVLLRQIDAYVTNVATDRPPVVPFDAPSDLGRQRERFRVVKFATIQFRDGELSATRTATTARAYCRRRPRTPNGDFSTAVAVVRRRGVRGRYR
jgi:hypothetical protein